MWKENEWKCSLCYHMLARTTVQTFLLTCRSRHFQSLILEQLQQSWAQFSALPGACQPFRFWNCEKQLLLLHIRVVFFSCLLINILSCWLLAGKTFLGHFHDIFLLWAVTASKVEHSTSKSYWMKCLYIFFFIYLFYLQGAEMFIFLYIQPNLTYESKHIKVNLTHCTCLCHRRWSTLSSPAVFVF